jgi:hypothetical protein
LPVTIVPGMTVVEASDGTRGTIAGITETYCIYRGAGTDTLAVSPWDALALANICPARPLLPADTTERDRRNTSAAVLHELLTLQQFGLSDKQQAVMSELIAELCPGSV